MKTLRWTVSTGLVALACAATFGCEKSSETQKREADKAAAEADKKQAQATSEADEKTREARAKAESEGSDVHAAVVREKNEYRTKIHDALDRLDKDLADFKVDTKQIRRGDRSKDLALYGKDASGKERSPKDYDKIESMLLHRDRLMDLNDRIDTTTDQDWPSYKERISHEIENKEKPLVKPGRT